MQGDGEHREADRPARPRIRRGLRLRTAGARGRLTLLFTVSGHGYGHATRIRALIAALRARAPGLPIHVRTEAPHWIFSERDPAVACSAAPLDVGILQPNGLDLELGRTLRAHQAFGAGWEAALARETAFLRALGPALVVGDLPPLSFEAARRAGLPAVGIANFSWDWVLEPYAEAEPRWRSIVARYRAAYAHCDTLFRLPLHGAFPAFRRVVDVPLLVNRSGRSREACRAALGVAPGDPRRLVLVSFGGFGGVEARCEAAEPLSDYLFAGFSPPPPGLRADWIPLPRPAPMPHEDLVHACDAVLGKPGYGSVAEALAHDARFLYLPRRDYREIPVLEEALARHGRARCMPREDFVAGRWRRHLDALFELPPPPSTLASDGAEVLARHLLEALARG